MATDWRASLRERGYAHLPRLVPAERLEAARAAIRDDLTRHYDAAREREYSSRTYCPKLVGKRPIMDLFERSPVLALVEAALGVDALTWDRGQIAIRWAHNVDRELVPAPHLDGIASADNGVAAGSIQSLTAIVGVFLTTTPRAFAGNLTVWPGTHRLYERYFRDRGPRALFEPLPAIDLGAPLQLVCEAGDVVLMHYELVHTASVNTSDVDRIAVYFRLAWRDLDEHRWEYLASLWRGWRIGPSPRTP
jgi:Phytanoyl-CoA dioxygenase (PhyH)